MDHESLPARGSGDLTVSGAMKIKYMRKIILELRKNSVSPSKVMSAAEAKQMTDDDPSGHVWHVGEEYFRLEYIDGAYKFHCHPKVKVTDA